MDRLRCAFLLVAPARGWTVSEAAYGGLWLRSPRTTGQVRFSAVRMPEELGAYDVERLWDRMRPRGWTPPGLFRVDEMEWTSEGVHGVAYSTVWDVSRELAEIEAAPDLLSLCGEPLRDLPPRIVRRDWRFARGALVVDAFYSTADEPDAVPGPGIERDIVRLLAEDLLDCEDMVRGAVFDDGL